MKKILIYLTCALCFGLLLACGGSNENTDQLKKQVDSLTTLNAQYQGDLSNMTEYVSFLAEGLDTIAKQEGALFYTNKGKEGTMVDKAQLKKNLEAFADNLSELRKKVKNLEGELNEKGENMAKLQKLIAVLNQQIEEKDAMIRNLRAEIENKNVSIAQLRGLVSNLSKGNTELSQKVEAQEKQIAAQNAKMNTGYVVMGSSKILKENGIIVKSKVNYGNLPLELFTKVDVRTFGGLQIPTAKPKMLSNIPSSAYEFVKTSKTSSELHVLNPEAFWSNGKYIVIQTK
jgi:predicted  nucleic acid-binding Zn-ribbon protein